MHDRNKLCSELSLNITGNVLDCGGDGVSSGEGKVHNYAKVLDLEVSLYKASKGHLSSK